MRETSVFDIISPIMAGPSSSHTAGAVRLGLLARNIYAGYATTITFKLYNSYASTGKGHGTDKGLLAGFLGLSVDDARIKTIFESELVKNLDYSFEFFEDFNRHPNAVDIIIDGETTLSVSGKSIGAGEVIIDKINGFAVNLSGKYNTLMLIYEDIPHMISKITSKIDTNIAALNCDRYAKGDKASMCISLDGELSTDVISQIKNMPRIYMTRYIEKLES